MAMLRYNAGKIPLALIPSSFFEAIFNSAYELDQALPTKLLWLVGEVLDFGAQKYSAHNWRKGGSWTSVLNSALRHNVRMINGFTTDAESGLSEAGHLGCNIAFLLEFVLQGIGDDDRFITTLAPLGLETQPEPSLVWVLHHLLAFRDGSDYQQLVSAAWELSRWLEAQPEPRPETTVQAPVETPPRQVPSHLLPFSFPAFNGEYVVYH